MSQILPTSKRGASTLEISSDKSKRLKYAKATPESKKAGPPSQSLINRICKELHIDKPGPGKSLSVFISKYESKLVNDKQDDTL